MNKLVLHPPKKKKQYKMIIIGIIIILIIDVLKAALNNFRGHITAKDCLRRPKIVHFGLQQANAGGHSPLGYAIDCKFGFDFGFWAKLI